jgi:hypothetical protein
VGRPQGRGQNRLGYRYLDYQIGDDTLPLAKSYILNEFIIQLSSSETTFVEAGLS